MSSLYLFLLCCVAGWLLHLWFYTDFFAYYLRTFKFIFPQKIYDWFLVDSFFTDDTDTDSFIDYLYLKRGFTNNFIIKFFLKLFSCGLCLTSWLSIVISLIYGNILYTGLIFIILRLIDFILRFANK